MREKKRSRSRQSGVFDEGVGTVTKTRAGEGTERTSVLVVREDGGQHEKFKHDPQAPEDALRDMPCVQAVPVLGLVIRAFSSEAHGGHGRGEGHGGPRGKRRYEVRGPPAARSALDKGGLKVVGEVLEIYNRRATRTYTC